MISARDEPRAFGGAVARSRAPHRRCRSRARARATRSRTSSTSSTSTTPAPPTSARRSPVRAARRADRELPGQLPVAVDRGTLGLEPDLHPGRPGRLRSADEPARRPLPDLGHRRRLQDRRGALLHRNRCPGCRLRGSAERSARRRAAAQPAARRDAPGAGLRGQRPDQHGRRTRARRTWPASSATSSTPWARSRPTSTATRSAPGTQGRETPVHATRSRSTQLDGDMLPIPDPGHRWRVRQRRDRDARDPAPGLQPLRGVRDPAGRADLDPDDDPRGQPRLRRLDHGGRHRLRARPSRGAASPCPCPIFGFVQPLHNGQPLLGAASGHIKGVGGRDQDLHPAQGRRLRLLGRQHRHQGRRPDRAGRGSR